MKIFCWTDSLDCLFWIHNIKKKIETIYTDRCFKDFEVLAAGISVSAIVSGRLAKSKNFEKSNESHCLEELSSSGIDADTKNIFSFEKYNSFQNLIRITSFVDQL